PWVSSFSACISNGTRFHTESRGKHRRTQNSGVVVKGEHQSKAVDFYGVLIDILQLKYMGWRHVFLFRCEWFDVAQVFYLQDNSKRGNWSVVQRVTSRNTYDVPIIPSEQGDEDDDQNLNYAAFQENEPSYAVLEPEEDDNGISSPLHRTDVEPIDVPGDTVLGDAIPTPGDDDFIDDE
ncbi:hypothetical protein CIPAW_04G171500, partial [Carya illinoinensis]